MKQVISLGMGVQSTALYLMSSLGALPRADAAVFADTGKEGKGTYRYLAFLQQWQKKNRGIPITVLHGKNLYKDLLRPRSDRPFVFIPGFTKDPEDGSTGMLRRQCTSEYKIIPINNWIRDKLYGLPKRARRPKTGLWLGITRDEAYRVSNPPESWKINVYPFLGRTLDKSGAQTRPKWAMPMTRSQVASWYTAHGFPVPTKSSCVFCPFQSDRAWAYRKKHTPGDFAAAVKIDRAIRSSTRKGIRNPVFLHRSCKPLVKVAFDETADEAWGECTGNCHI